MGRVPFLATNYSGGNRTLVRALASYLGDVAILEFCGPGYSKLNDLASERSTPELERMYSMFSLIKWQMKKGRWYG